MPRIIPGDRPPKLRMPTHFLEPHCACFRRGPSPWRWPAASAESDQGSHRVGQQYREKVDEVGPRPLRPPTEPEKRPVSGRLRNSCEKRNGKNEMSNREVLPLARFPAASKWVAQRLSR